MLLRYLIVLGAFASFTGLARAATPPNILFILTDDQGWPTLGCYGSTKVATSHLDRLAAGGVRFTAAYVTPQCTPTRAAILTGQHPARSGMWHVIGWYGYPWAPVREPAFTEQLSRDTYTVAKGLQAAGYRTALLGKWHLTTNADGNYNQLQPTAAGFYGFDVVNKPGPGHNAGDKDVNHLTDEAISFITENKDRPWFCLLTHYTVHGPVSAPVDLVAKHRHAGAPAEGPHNATYLAAIEHLDASVGRLLAALDAHRLSENTLVVFLSDNGGVSYQYDVKPYLTGDATARTLRVDKREFDNTPLRGTKGSLYEGGIRVPCLVRWPGIAKAGFVCDTPIQATDWLPTLLDAAGVRLPETVPHDGVSIRPLLTGQPIPERSIYWHAPLYDLRWGATPAAACRSGRFKLIEFFGDSFGPDGVYRPGHRVELYDLNKDPAEANDLAATDPATAAKLSAELHRFLKSMNAEVPGPNPDHDPKQPFRETKVKPTQPPAAK
jgi:uncharacterized sulfatase